MFKALLCIPPTYSYTYDSPPLGTPMLAGYLKDKGIEVIQADYNIGYLDYWKKRVNGAQVLEDVSISESLVVARSLLNKLFALKRQKGYYYSQFLLPDFTSSAYADDTNTSFHFTERLLSSPYLQRYIEDKEENTFLQFFLDEDILALIETNGVDLVGLSVISPSQVIAALTLGHLIKQNLPCVHVTIGGQWVSLYRNELIKRPEWFEFFDSMIIFEGETPLYRLTIALEQGGDLACVPNLIYQADSKWVLSSKNSLEDMNDLSCPDFYGLPLGRYRLAEKSGGAALTYQTARDCYWNKCIYCVDLPFPKQNYRQRNKDLIIMDIKRLIDKYGMHFLEISNPTMSPGQLREMSQAIIKEGLKFSWWCFARIEPAFTKDLFGLAKKAGCQAISFGLESANQRVLDFIRKGIGLECAKKVIVDCHEAGIGVDLQMMMGLPSETLLEGLDTVNFLIDYRDYLGNVVFNEYYLTPACEIYLNPSQYGIDYKKYPDLPFKFFHDFSHLSGELDTTKAENLINMYRRMILRKYPQRAGTNKSAFAENHEFSLRVGDDQAGLVYRFNKEKKAGLIIEDEELDRCYQA